MKAGDNTQGAISISATDGAIRIEGVPQALVPGMSKDIVRAQLAGHFRHHIDHGNGYEWLSFQDLTLGGESAGLSICFRHGKLSEAQWGIALANAEGQGGWPAKGEIDDEIAFAIRTLSKMLSRSFVSGVEHFPWGVVWANFDAKAVQATSGLRYTS